jgi:hypothetical protein
MEARVSVKSVRRFPDLQRLARERGYTVERDGHWIFWWRNEDPVRRYESHGIASAAEDIILDHSSKKHLGAGTRQTPGERT